MLFFQKSESFRIDKSTRPNTERNPEEEQHVWEMKNNCEIETANYCMKSGLALSTVFSDYSVEHLKNICNKSDIAGLMKIKQMKNLVNTLARLDKKQSVNNDKIFRKEYEKIDSEYNKEVKLWQDQQEKKRSEVCEKETIMKKNKSVDRKEDKKINKK